MLFSLLKSLLIGILFADMLERRYPEEFKQFIITLSFNCIYLFSRLQIMVTITNSKFNKFIEDNPPLLKLKNDINNILPQKSKKNQIEKTEYNFSILNIQENNVFNKKIIYNNDYEETFENSDIKFIMVEFYIGETVNNKYKIDLKTDIFNYYLVGNKFTKEFFMFYIKHHLNVNDNITVKDKCSIKIIDHNVDSFQIEFTDKNESIILNKNNYTLELNLDN